MRRHYRLELVVFGLPPRRTQPGRQNPAVVDQVCDRATGNPRQAALCVETAGPCKRPE